jgi:HD-GYP domain-containing protein (c-di-GMP phosphodiesterase class II)
MRESNFDERTLLALRDSMLKYAPFVLGAAAGAFYIKERRARLAIERVGAATMEALLDAIDANNPETGAHVRRVADYSLELAKAADLDDRTQHSVERVALFHDIGKLDGAISDIVNESTKLTAAERRSIKEHPRRGAEVLRPLEAFYPELPEGVLSHHERWDGNGYPRKLRGSQIPIEARVVAIADTFDAITQSRPYSSARTLEAATNIISEGRGTQFDPDLVDLFLSPPVISYIEHSMQKLLSPKLAHKRRRTLSHKGAPDINFRWRTVSPLLRRADR